MLPYHLLGLKRSMLRGHVSVAPGYSADPKLATSRSYDDRGSRDIFPIQVGALNNELPRTSWPSSCAPKKAANNEVLHNPNAPLLQAEFKL
jgi:hypothetical protein